jgi:TonB family protein
MTTMDALIYLGKVNLYWVIFYICYRLFLHRHTFFVLNRAYLISSLILAMVLPAIHLPEEAPIVIQSAVYAVNTLPAYANITMPIAEPFPTIPWDQSIFALIGAGGAFMLARLLHVFRSLFKVINQGDAITFEDHTLVLLPHNETGSFSFLNWLVINRNDYENNLDVILRHELTHIKQMHSYDILLIESLKIVCWFNPALWLYKQSIQEIHEFLADESAPNRERYATFLVSYGLQAPIQSLTNHFFNSSLLKNRIVMIYKTRTPNWLLGKYAMIIPVILIIVLSTASNPQLNPTKKATKVKTHIPKIQTEKAPALNDENKTNNPAVNETTEIKGVIVDTFNKPISKASLLANTTLLGKTDENGKFLIKNIDTNSPIFISHVSYDPQQLKAEKSQTNYKIILTRKKTMLNEIVVIAYAGKDVTPTTNSTDLEYSLEKMPEFPGGQKEMYKYLVKKVHYPTKAARAKIQGSVYITFTVDENGSILNPKVVKGLGYGMDEEAIRVVSNMPKWIPAEQNGEKVSMDFNLPVKFALEN